MGEFTRALNQYTRDNTDNVEKAVIGKERLNALLPTLPNSESLKHQFEMSNVQIDRDVSVWKKKNEDFLVKQLAMERQLMGRIDQGLGEIKAIHDTKNNDFKLDTDKTDGATGD